MLVGVYKGRIIMENVYEKIRSTVGWPDFFICDMVAIRSDRLGLEKHGCADFCTAILLQYKQS